MTRTLTLEGDVNSADARTIITAQGSIAAPSLVVPAGMRKIRKIYASASVDYAAAGAANFLVRLGGSAVLNGEQNIIIGGAGGQAGQAGADPAGSNPYLFVLDDADLDISPSDTLSVACEAVGSDLGDATFSLTVVYGR